MASLQDLLKMQSPKRGIGRVIGDIGYRMAGQEPPQEKEDTFARDLLGKMLVEKMKPQVWKPSTMEEAVEFEKAKAKLKAENTVPKPLKPPGKQGFQTTAVVDSNVVPVRPYIPPREEAIPKITPQNRSTAKYLKEVLSYDTREEALADLVKYRSAIELEGADYDAIQEEIIRKLPPSNLLQRTGVALKKFRGKYGL